MTAGEQRRAQVLTRVLQSAITLKEAAIVMGLSLRQARRLKGLLIREGPVSLAHGNRGQISPRRLDELLPQRLPSLSVRSTTTAMCAALHRTPGRTRSEIGRAHV